MLAIGEFSRAPPSVCLPPTLTWRLALAAAVGNYWLAWWADDRFHQTARWYLVRYGLLSSIQVGITLMRQILRSVSSVRASRMLAHRV